jgi:hypothetical protein
VVKRGEEVIPGIVVPVETQIVTLPENAGHTA